MRFIRLPQSRGWQAVIGRLVIQYQANSAPKSILIWVDSGY